MRKISSCIGLLVCLNSISYAGTGKLFEVSTSGQPGNVSFSLCLDGKAPLSCQHFNVDKLSLNIKTTMPNHVYPNAGIKINTPNLEIANIGLVCKPISNGYCTFSVARHAPASLTIQKKAVIEAPIQLTAIGYDMNAGLPLLAQSINSGLNWSLVPIPNIPTGAFNGTSCTGSGSAAICIAVGSNYDTSYPLLTQSTNGGANWTVTDISNIPTGKFNAASCTGSGSKAICIAVGDNGNYNSFLAQSTNGGASWATVNVANIRPTNLSSASCTGSGAEAICTAVGFSQDSNAVLIQSNDGGLNWSQVDISTSLGYFNGVSCTGSGATAICTAVGAIYPINPLLTQSTDGGKNWSVVTLPGMLAGFLYASSCTGTGSEAICTAVGGNFGDGYPLLAQTTNGGADWSVVSILNIPKGIFYSASCTGAGATAICTANGTTTDGNPILVQSRDGGAHWAVVAIPNISAGYFQGASCTGSGTSAICTAAGATATQDGYPLLAQTRDGGVSWSVVDIPNMPLGSFSGSGSSQPSYALSLQNDRARQGLKH